MCGAMTVAIPVCVVLLIPASVLARSAFVASVDRHRMIAPHETEKDELTDDAGVTAFERVHLRKLIRNDFADQSDVELLALIRKARGLLGTSAGIGGLLVLLLAFRTSAFCS